MFKKAERRQAKMKLAITGPSGAGKTFSALRLATGLGGKIAVIDTENGSASLYSDQFAFDVLEMAPPFTVEKYVDAINAAEKAGYETLVLDSITHLWAGEGGLLDQKEQLDARGKGNSYTNWASITKKHELFKAAMLHSPINIVATMRSKQDYILSEKNGKQVPQKAGFAPIQRDGMEYEFTIVFDVQMDHKAEASKDRTGLFTDKLFQVTEQTGKMIRDWLESGKAVEPTKPAPAPQANVQSVTGNGNVQAAGNVVITADAVLPPGSVQSAPAEPPKSKWVGVTLPMRNSLREFVDKHGVGRGVVVDWLGQRKWEEITEDQWIELNERVGGMAEETERRQEQLNMAGLGDERLK